MRGLLIVGTLVVLVAALITLNARRASAAAMLKAGETAPNFQTQMVIGSTVKPVSLSDYKGQTVVLYFYPKDMTPGCTKEACAFRDGYSKLTNAGLVVLGCSVDTADAHKAFIQKYGLPFPLLLDPDKKIATAYGAANGIPVMGLDRRITYIIGADGKIVKVYPKVDPSTHASEILAGFATAKPAAAPAAAAQ